MENIIPVELINGRKADHAGPRKRCGVALSCSDNLISGRLSATDPVIYRDANKRYDMLRARIRAAGVSRVAREAKVSRSIVKASVNQGATPHSTTIARLEAALARLGT